MGSSKPPVRDVIRELGGRQRDTARELGKHEQNLYGLFFETIIDEPVDYVDIPEIPQYGRILRIEMTGKSTYDDITYYPEWAVRTNGEDTEGSYDWAFDGDNSEAGWEPPTRTAMAFGFLGGIESLGGYLSRQRIECKNYALDDGLRKHWHSSGFYAFGFDEEEVSQSASQPHNGYGVGPADPVTSVRLFTWHTSGLSGDIASVGSYDDSTDQFSQVHVIARILA